MWPCNRRVTCHPASSARRLHTLAVPQPRRAISDAAGNHRREDDGHHEVGPGHASEMATQAGQGRAHDERQGGGDEVFHRRVGAMGLTIPIISDWNGRGKCEVWGRDYGGRGGSLRLVGRARFIGE